MRALDFNFFDLNDVCSITFEVSEQTNLKRI
jgi:hypothetical protein